MEQQLYISGEKEIKGREKVEGGKGEEVTS